MCVLPAREAFFSGRLLGFGTEGSLLGLAATSQARLGMVCRPKVVVSCGRESISTKKCVFGVDETTLDFGRVRFVSTRRELKTAVVQK